MASCIFPALPGTLVDTYAWLIPMGISEDLSSALENSWHPEALNLIELEVSSLIYTHELTGSI